MNFLITTDKNQIPDDTIIVMIDGTVPGWEPKQKDLHYDHHRLGGALCQLDELPLSKIPINEGIFDNATFVSTQVDADCIVAAASLILSSDGYNIPKLWRAIALDCDHLTCNIAEETFSSKTAQQARNIVAGLKENDIADRLKLSKCRREWSKQNKQQYASTAFKEGVEELIRCCLDNDYSSIEMKAQFYWKKQMALKQKLAEENRISTDSDIYYFNFKNWDGGYCDPRMPLDLASGSVNLPVTVTVREVFNQNEFQGFSYTVGSNPHHPKYGSFDFCQMSLWQKLTEAEQAKNPSWGIDTDGKTQGWGGRATVGGSSWNNPSTLSPEEVGLVIKNAFM